MEEITEEAAELVARVAALVCWISVCSPRGGYLPASRRVASHPMAHSTRLEECVAVRVQ
jgi:hypothetical protein